MVMSVNLYAFIFHFNNSRNRISSHAKLDRVQRLPFWLAVIFLWTPGIYKTSKSRLVRTLVRYCHYFLQPHDVTVDNWSIWQILRVCLWLTPVHITKKPWTVCSGGQLTASVPCLAKNLPYLSSQDHSSWHSLFFWLKSSAKALEAPWTLNELTLESASCEVAHLFLTANSYP